MKSFGSRRQARLTIARPGDSTVVVIDPAAARTYKDEAALADLLPGVPDAVEQAFAIANHLCETGAESEVAPFRVRFGAGSHVDVRFDRQADGTVALTPLIPQRDTQPDYRAA